MPRVPKHTHDATYAQRFHDHDELSPEGHGSVYVAPTRTITAGAGLTGGGDLSANRTLDVGVGTGISVAADAVSLDTAHARNVDHSGVVLTAGAGLTGGGDISLSRTFNVVGGTGIQANADNIELTAAAIASLALADTAVQPARQVISGAGLTGGGDLSVDRTLAVGAGTGISVAADAVSVDQGFSPVWTANHVWSSASPALIWEETDAASDEKRWAWNANGNTISFYTQSDAGAFGSYIWRAFRSGTSTERMQILAPLQVNSLHTTGVLLSGTYTPTLTNTTNVAASTAHTMFYTRVGDVVHVAGEVDVDPTTAGLLTTVEISLPIASALTHADQLGGTGADTLGTPAWACAGNAAGDNAFMTTAAITGEGSRAVRVAFTYRVL